jgi:hypothetical protein
MYDKPLGCAKGMVSNGHVQIIQHSLRQLLGAFFFVEHADLPNPFHLWGLDLRRSALCRILLGFGTVFAAEKH